MKCQILSVVLALSACTGNILGPRESLARTPIPVAALHATHGQLEALDEYRARVSGASVRAELDPTPTHGVELTFMYEGPTAEAVPLASGELRQQLGLKLLSLDTCNVTYVMWRLAPHAEIHVSQKVNLGMARHAECRDGGYRDVPAAFQASVLPAVASGQEHKLAAQLEGALLRVSVDDTLVWRGRLHMPSAASSGGARSGIRADNAAFVFSLAAIGP